MDTIDGGISVLLRCPGGLPAAEGLVIDTLLPASLSFEQNCVRPTTPSLVQIFAQEIALPHLLRLRNSCRLAAVPIPPQVTSTNNGELHKNAQHSFTCHHFRESQCLWDDLVAIKETFNDDLSDTDNAWWAEASELAINTPHSEETTVDDESISSVTISSVTQCEEAGEEASEDNATHSASTTLSPPFNYN
jgi:hypothetical protein